MCQSHIGFAAHQTLANGIDLYAGRSVKAFEILYTQTIVQDEIEVTQRRLIQKYDPH